MKGLKVGASALMQRMGIGSLLGSTFEGKRDLYKVFGYTPNVKYAQAIARYRRQDIASRIIDAMANALWSNPPEITSDDAGWNKAWNDLVINHGLWNAVSRADKLAGMGDYSLLLIGLSSSGKLDTPARTTKERKVLYLQPYGYDSIKIKTLVDNPNDSRYMKPQLYTITPQIQNEIRTTLLSKMSSLAGFDTDASRVLHVAENYLTDEIFGNPRIERVWNLLDDLLKVAGGTAETFWLTANRGIQIDVDKEMELSPDDEKDLTDEVEEYIHNIRRFIRTRGVKVNPLGSEVPSPQQVFNMIISLISGATGIPKRILLGSEAGQLASDQDRANWAERVEERRADFGEPVIIWPLIRMLTSAGVLPDKTNVQITIKWPDAFRMSPLEKAQTSAQQARSAANLTKAMTTMPNFMDVEEGRKIAGLDKKPKTIDSDTLIEDSGTPTGNS
jgi:hypothetical protein